MPKRKRSPSLEISAINSLGRRKKLCTQRLQQASKPLVAALRHAAVLERQKHSRRKKTAQASKDEKALARLEAEYAHLKALDLDKVAEQHLRKTIAKVKSLRESECLPESARQLEKGSSDPALLNVKGRLFKVDAVRKVVDAVVGDLKEIVGAGVALMKEGDKGQKMEKDKPRSGEEGEEKHVTMDVDEDSEAFAALDALIAAPSSADEDSEESLSDGHRPPSIEDTESDDDNESPPVADLLGEDGETPAFHNFSDEEDLSGASNSETEEQSTFVSKTKRKNDSQVINTHSKFLPALSHPTYISGSESEASDIEVAPRKNRRGQKARQKIWEQKYKDKAKHLQKQDRSKGWDVKRGAVEDAGGYRARGGRGGPPRGRGPEKSGANEQPLGARKTQRDDKGVLHPSWQAAKTAKEKKMHVKPMGKKVVFD